MKVPYQLEMALAFMNVLALQTVAADCIVEIPLEHQRNMEGRFGYAFSVEAAPWGTGRTR